MTKHDRVLSSLDSFPFRYRLGEVMTPSPTAAADLRLADACRLMDEGGTSAIVITGSDGAASGIVTERDILRLLVRHGAESLSMPLGDVMSAPVHAMTQDAYLYRGIGRMTRLGLRHLVVVDGAGRPLGLVTGRTLLTVRANRALVIGDDLAAAATGADMGRVRDELPRLARHLLEDGVSVHDVAGILSGVLRDMTARAAMLAEQELAAAGWGSPPATYALLALGSAGRGETLLSSDQDNALVHAGTRTDNGWFAEFGRRLNDLLAEAGIPYCPGEVMVRNPFWRRSLDEWQAELRHWVFEPELRTIMNVDIFFDFQMVHGDAGLADALKTHALRTAGSSAFFLQSMALNVANMDDGLTVLGRFAARGGQLDAKRVGLLPLVGAVRVRALKAGIAATATSERLAGLAMAGLIHESDRAGLDQAHETILGVVLRQQLVDVGAGRAPSSKITPVRMDRLERLRLRDAFQRIADTKVLMSRGT